MSIHLKAGAPAFSPNNMRVGLLGGKKVVTKNNNNPKENNKNKNKKKNKKNWIEK